jgi:hypothetical protein
MHRIDAVALYVRFAPKASIRLSLVGASRRAKSCGNGLCACKDNIASSMKRRRGTLSKAGAHAARAGKTKIGEMQRC